MVTKISNNNLSQAKAQGVAILDFLQPGAVPARCLPRSCMSLPMKLAAKPHFTALMWTKTASLPPNTAFPASPAWSY